MHPDNVAGLRDAHPHDPTTSHGKEIPFCLSRASKSEAYREGHSRPTSEHAHRDLGDTCRKFCKNACKDCPCCYDRLCEYDLYHPMNLDYPMHGQRVLAEVHLVGHCLISAKLIFAKSISAKLISAKSISARLHSRMVRIFLRSRSTCYQPRSRNQKKTSYLIVDSRCDAPLIASLDRSRDHLLHRSRMYNSKKLQNV